MNEDNASKGSCREDIFVQQQRSLNICPHRSMKTYKTKLLKKLENEKYELEMDNKTTVRVIDPKERKKIQEELQVFQEKKEEEIALLKTLRSTLNTTFNSMKQLQEDDYIFKYYHKNKELARI